MLFFTVDGPAGLGSTAGQGSSQTDKAHLAIVRPEDKRFNQELPGDVYR